MAQERHDAVFLPLLSGAGGSLTAARLRERCSDPWAASHTDEWLREALERGLVAARRQADLPVEWSLTKLGERATP
jgi:hypothetical protein